MQKGNSMYCRKTALVLGLVALGMPAGAHSQTFFDGFRVAPEQTVRGLYIGAGAGANLHNNQRRSPDRDRAAGFATLNVSGRGTAIFEPGFAGVFAVGYGFGYGL